MTYAIHADFGHSLIDALSSLAQEISNVQDIRMHHVAVEKSEVSDSQNLLSNSSSKGNKVMRVSNGENAGGHFWWGEDKRSHL